MTDYIRRVYRKSRFDEVSPDEGPTPARGSGDRAGGGDAIMAKDPEERRVDPRDRSRRMTKVSFVAAYLNELEKIAELEKEAVVGKLLSRVAGGLGKTKASLKNRLGAARRQGLAPSSAMTGAAPTAKTVRAPKASPTRTDPIPTKPGTSAGATAGAPATGGAPGATATAPTKPAASTKPAGGDREITVGKDGPFGSAKKMKVDAQGNPVVGDQQLRSVARDQILDGLTPAQRFDYLRHTGQIRGGAMDRAKYFGVKYGLPTMSHIGMPIAMTAGLGMIPTGTDAYGNRTTAADSLPGQIAPWLLGAPMTNALARKSRFARMMKV